MTIDKELAKALEETGFERCEFGPDDDECEECGKANIQLYFRGSTDAGTYCCAACILSEAQQNRADFQRAMARAVHTAN